MITNDIFMYKLVTITKVTALVTMVLALVRESRRAMDWHSQGLCVIGGGRVSLG